MAKRKRKSSRRTTYFSVAQFAGALGALDNFYNVSNISPKLNQLANPIRGGVSGIVGANPFINALGCLVLGGVASKAANTFAPGARLRVGKYGVKI